MEDHYFKLHIDDEDNGKEGAPQADTPPSPDKPLGERIVPADETPTYNLKPQKNVQSVLNPKTGESYHSENTKSSNILGDSQESSEPGKKRKFLEIFKDGLHQLAFSFLFLVVGFVLLNWSAISQFVVHNYREWTGAVSESPLNSLIEPDDLPIGDRIISRNTLQINADDFQEIPPLDLEIAPNDDRIIIPRIEKNIPIVRVSTESLIKRDFAALETEMQAALQDGVVHYPGTSLPGQRGNTVITGHSSYFPWDPGRFKDVFALLHDVEIGDRIVIYYKQDKYTYEINDIEVVLPDNINILKQTPQDTLTLITCTPIGTNLKRLIVRAKPIAINDKLI